MDIKQVPSPNFLKGRKNFRPEAIVIHIMEGTLAGTDSWFRNPVSNVSAHYGIGLNGAIHRYVAEEDTAWHAGRVHQPTWQTIRRLGNGTYLNPNLYTIGLEHEGRGHTDWPEAMYAASAALIRDICTRWRIPIDRQHIVGHNEIYGRKTCPGNRVDLDRLVALAARPGGPEAVQEPGNARTRVRLHLRSGPSRSATRLATVNADTPLAFEGYTAAGEAVQGNSRWYFNAAGQWFWAGGVLVSEDVVTP